MGRRFFFNAYRVLRWFAPWLFRVCVAVVKSLILSFVTWWVGAPNTVRKIASDWTRKARLPLDLENHFYNCACVVASLMVALSWVVSSYVTVWVVQWLLR